MFHLASLPYNMFSFGPVCFDNLKVVLNFGTCFAAILAQVSEIFPRAVQNKKLYFSEFAPKIFSQSFKEKLISELEMKY